MQILSFKVRYTSLITNHGCNPKDNRTTVDCGLCAINNAYSNEKLTVDQLDNIADDLWLRQIEQFSLDLTDELQIQRDVNGFYSFEVLREVVGCFGDQLLNLNELVHEPLTLAETS